MDIRETAPVGLSGGEFQLAFLVQVDGMGSGYVKAGVDGDVVGAGVD